MRTKKTLGQVCTAGLVVVLVVGYTRPASAASVEDYAVELSAALAANQVTLNWKASSSATGYTVYAKDVSGTSWGSPIATLPSSAAGFTDSSPITKGGAREYFWPYSGRDGLH
jgi:hypothetical protein